MQLQRLAKIAKLGYPSLLSMIRLFLPSNLPGRKLRHLANLYEKHVIFSLVILSQNTRFHNCNIYVTTTIITTLQHPWLRL